MKITIDQINKYDKSMRNIQYTAICELEKNKYHFLAISNKTKHLHNNRVVL